MRNILFTALLGCIIASGLAQQDSFQFTDSQGRCWTCSPGQPCVPCANNLLPLDRIVWPQTCPIPDCSDVANRGTLFPINNDPTAYHQCVLGATSWAPVRVECQCSTYFDYQQGNCQSVWDWNPHCLITGPLPDPISCDDEVPTTPAPTTLVPTTVEVTTPAPTTSQPCNPCNPCMPCMIWWMCQPCNQQCNSGCMG